MKTELEKMLSGELYNAADLELVELRNRARRMARAYNATTETELARRCEILAEWFGLRGCGAAGLGGGRRSPEAAPAARGLSGWGRRIFLGLAPARCR
jgi:hypothetical protein